MGERRYEFESFAMSTMIDDEYSMVVDEHHDYHTYPSQESKS
jgi:hypothetical protein